MSYTVEVTELPYCQLHPVREPLMDAAKARFDAKTNQGPWAYLCAKCWANYTPGVLGTGRGQYLIERKATKDE